MKAVPVKSLFNARPHPGPLPRGEGESFAASLVDLRLDSREAIRNFRECSHAVPFPGREGQGECGGDTIQLEPAYVGCYKSR